MDVRDAYHVCRYLIFVERIGDTRLVYEEVTVREDLVHAKETDIFQFLGVGYVVLLGDLIYQYSRQIAHPIWSRRDAATVPSPSLRHTRRADFAC